MITPEEVQAYEELLGAPIPGKLAKLLNEKEYTTKSGKKWTYNHVYYYFPKPLNTSDENEKPQPEYIPLETAIVDVLSDYVAKQEATQKAKSSLLNKAKLLKK